MKNMVVIFFILFFSTYSAVFAKKMIVIRHAERALGQDKLSAEGRERSEHLAELLSHEKVVSIYSTDYNRTKSTVTPISLRKSLPIKIYSVKEDLQQKWDLLLGDEVMVVVGHSNTAPEIAGYFAQVALDDLDDATEFNRMFSVIKEGQTVRLLDETYDF